MAGPDIARLRMVRGGNGRSDTVLKAALVLFTEAGRPGVSVFAADLSDSDLVRWAGPSLPHAVVRFGWVRCLVDAGFEVEQTGQPLHHTVWFPDLHAATMAAFQACWEPPVANPRARR